MINKTVFITGCSSGIGKATARLFQEKGWNVAATMRDITKAAELEGLPGLKVYALDVRDEDAVKNAIAQAAADFGGIDVLVNNAGYGLAGPFEMADQAKIDDQFQTNVFGVFNTIRHVLPLMKAKQEGTIINITSIGGIVAYPFNSLYHATKFAIDGFSTSLQFELEPFNIRVKVVAPGGVETDFSGRSMVFTTTANDADYAAGIQKTLQGFAARAQYRTTPAQVAEVIYDAATDGTATMRYISGAEAQASAAARYQMSLEDFYARMKAAFDMN